MEESVEVYEYESGVCLLSAIEAEFFYYTAYSVNLFTSNHIWHTNLRKGGLCPDKWNTKQSFWIPKLKYSLKTGEFYILSAISFFSGDIN